MLNLADKHGVAKSFRGKSYYMGYIEASLLRTGVFWHGTVYRSPRQEVLQVPSTSADEHQLLLSIGWRGLEVHYIIKVVIKYSPQIVFFKVLENPK